MSPDKVLVHDGLSLAHSVPQVVLDTTVGETIWRNGNRHSARVAIVSDHEGLSKTFKQLFDDSCTLAEALVTRCGLKHGDHVAIATGNCYNYFVSFLACAIKGFVVWHYDPNMAPNEVDRLIDTTLPAAIFTLGQGSRQHHFFPNVAAITSKLRIRGVQVIAVDGGRHEGPKCHHIDHLLHRQQNGAFPTYSSSTVPSDPLLVLVTSGSTGAPKMVMWSHGGILATEQFWFACAGFKDNDKVCLPLSAHHAFAHHVLRSLLFHGHQVILTGYKYSLTQTVACLVKYECNYVALVPTMLHDILGHVVKNGLELKLTDVIFSSTILTEKMAAWMTSILPGIECHQFYAMSEMLCSGIATRCRFDTVGKPFGDCLVKVVSESGHVVPHGQAGRLMIKTKLGMLGYLKQDGSLENPILDAEGFTDTGDVFKMDAEGYLYYQGRVKDIINRAGFKVSPKEVETIFLAVPDVLDCVVIGIPDKRLGEEVIAVVQLQENSCLGPADLIALTAGQISKSKMPRKVHVSTLPLPRLTSLKHDKVTLKAKMATLLQG